MRTRGATPDDILKDHPDVYEKIDGRYYFKDITDPLNPLYHISRYPDGRWHFPTICGCWSCGGILSFTDLGGRDDKHKLHEDKYLAVEIARLQHGYYLARWEDGITLNSSDLPVPCSCVCKHLWVDLAGSEMFIHTCKCSRCGEVVSHDTSD